MSLHERRRQVLRDLAELEQQVVDGEIESSAADRLRRTYERELETLDAAADQMPGSGMARRPGAGWLGGFGWVVAAVVLVAAVGGISFLVARSAGERHDTTVEGLTPSDLASISEEDMARIIEQNPDTPQINAMRLALAEHYLEKNDHAEAFEWLEQVLDSNPTAAEAGEALARMGWMVHASGNPPLAESTLRRALEVDPSNDEARLFLGLVLVDTGRPDDALPYLEAVAARDDLPLDIRSVVDSAIARARSDG